MFHILSSKNKGFTLIELIIAIFILSVGILGVLGMFPLGIQVAKSSEMATVATQLAQAKTEEIISQPYQEIFIGEVIESPLPSPFNAYTRETKASYVDPLLDLQEIGIDKGIKKIEVTVSWESPLGVTEKNIQMITLINQK